MGLDELSQSGIRQVADYSPYLDQLAGLASEMGLSQRSNLVHLEKCLHAEWSLGQNSILSWCPLDQGILVLIVPHYATAAAIRQKFQALITRRQPEARDVFDLYVLSSQAEAQEIQVSGYLSADDLHQALERVETIEYEQYRDTVVGFLPPEEQERYNDNLMWDQIRLVVIGMIEKGIGDVE